MWKGASHCRSGELLGKSPTAVSSYLERTNCDSVLSIWYQIKQAMSFQEFFCNGLFGRLFLGNEPEGTERNFLLQTEIKSLWSSSYSYLLLPTEASENSNKISWNIDWMGICSCAYVVEFLRKHYSNGLQYFKGSRGNISLSRTGSSMTDCSAQNLVNFANSSNDVNNLANNLEDMVVLAIHTGRIYSIVEVVSSISAESPLEENADVASSDYTYVEYFKKTLVFIDLLHCIWIYSIFFCLIYMKTDTELHNNKSLLQVWDCTQVSGTASIAVEAKS